MTNQADDLEGTAYHEAGHVVAARSRRIKVDKATIAPRPGFAGCVYCASEPEPADRPSMFWLPEELRGLGVSDVERIFDYIIIAYAGPEAETRFLGRPNEYGAGYDHPRAKQLVKRIDMEYFYPESGGIPDGATAPADFGYRQQMRLNKLRNDAHRLVADRWPLVETVAKQLLVRRTMSSDEVREVIG